jgi:hypothetical protein
LLVLGIVAALVDDTNIDARVDTFEGIPGLRRREHAFATQHNGDRHLEASECFVYIHTQVVAEEGGHNETGIRLMSTGEDILNQFISDQTGIMITLAVVEATNSSA